jgi:hypothetical protein
MDRRRLLCVVVSSSVGLAAILAVGASAAGIAYAAEEVPAWTGPVRLELPGAQEPRLTRHSFTFARNLDYCAPRGTTEKVSLREVPVSAKYPHPSAVLTVTVAFPSFERPSVCPPLVYSYETLRVRTKRPAPSLWFYDGSFDPPRRIWPERAAHPR